MRQFIKDNFSHLYSQSQVEMYQDLSLYIFSGKYAGKALKRIYSEAFSFWHVHWSKAFDEIKLNFSSASDEFCRHDQIFALTFQDKVVGVVLMDSFDLTNVVHRRHSYFSNYPDLIIEKLAQLSGGGLTRTFGYLAIDPEYRKNYALADIILGTAIKRVTAEINPFMITYTRNTRKTHELTYRLGAKCIGERLKIRDEDSDFVYFDRSSLEVLKQHTQYPVMNFLWGKRITDIIYENQFHKGEINEESHL